MANNGNSTPPARDVTPSLPDYYRGYIIYEDDSEPLQFVVYDGRKMTRCASRQAAEAYINELHRTTPVEAVERMQRAYYRIMRASDDIGDVLGVPEDVKLQCNAIGVALRQLADNIDTMIAQLI